MNDTEIISKLNELLSASELRTEKLNFEESYDYFINLPCKLNNQGEEQCFCLHVRFIDSYGEVVRAIFQKGHIKRNYVYKTVDNKLQNFLSQLKMQDYPATERNFGRFFNQLNMGKAIKYSVFQKLHGIKVDESEPVKIGCFTLYNYENHKDKMLTDIMFRSEKKFLDFEKFMMHPVMISTDVNTVDNERVYELAVEKFEVFQGIFNFILDLSQNNPRVICIGRGLRADNERCYIFSNQEISRSFRNDLKFLANICIEDLTVDQYQLIEKLLNRLFPKENSNTKNEVSNRIKNAFSTYGRIADENINAQVLMLYVTVIESLIGFDSKDLTELLSSNVAAMISETKEEYKANKEDFRATYDQRSDIVHGGSTSVSGLDLAYAKKYAVELVREYVTDENILLISKNKDLKAYLERKVSSFEGEI